MRVADKMNFEQVNQNLAKNRSEMAHLQNQAATQKRVTKPSDDPVAAARVLASRVELAGSKQYLKNLDFSRGFLDFTDQSLGELTEQLVRAKELALSQANDAGANEQSRNVVATEIEQIYNQIVQIGNRQHGDRYIFAGFKTMNSPFDIKGKYKGDDGEMMIHVDKGSFMAMNLPGSKVFLGKGLAKDGVSSASEPQSTTIEEFMDRRRANREVQQQNPGNNLNGSEPLLENRGPANVNANTGVHTRPKSNGNLKQSELLPQNSIQGPSQQQVDSYSPQNGVNLFNVVDDLVVALRANDKGGVQDAIDTLDAATTQVVLARSQVGSRVMALNSAMETLQKAKVDNSTYISQLEDVDAFEVVSDINKTESTLQAALATSGKLIQPSLLDFLR